MQKVYIRFGFLLQCCLTLFCLLLLGATLYLFALYFSSDVAFLQSVSRIGFDLFVPAPDNFWIYFTGIAVLWILTLAIFLYQRWAMWLMVLAVSLLSLVGCIRVASSPDLVPADIISMGALLLFPLTFIILLIRLARMVRFGKSQIHRDYLTETYPGQFPIGLTLIFTIFLGYWLWNSYPQYADVPDDFFQRENIAFPLEAERSYCTLSSSTGKSIDPENLFLKKWILEEKARTDLLDLAFGSGETSAIHSFSGLLSSSGVLLGSGTEREYELFTQYNAEIDRLGAEIATLETEKPDEYGRMYAEVQFSSGEIQNISSILEVLAPITRLAPNGCITPDSSFFAPVISSGVLLVGTSLDTYVRYAIESQDFEEALRVMTIQRDLYDVLYREAISFDMAQYGLTAEAILLGNETRLLRASPGSLSGGLALLERTPSYESVVHDALLTEYERSQTLIGNGETRLLGDVSVPWLFDGKRTDNLLRAYIYNALESAKISRISGKSLSRDFLGYNPYGTPLLPDAETFTKTVRQARIFDIWKNALLEIYK